MSSASSSSSSSLPKIEVVVLWDHENAKVPASKLPGLRNKIEESLGKWNEKFALVEVIAFGPKRPSNFPARMTYKPLPVVTKPCEAAVPQNNCDIFVVDPYDSTGGKKIFSVFS